jgi:hypothetical protein
MRFIVGFVVFCSVISTLSPGVMSVEAPAATTDPAALAGQPSAPAAQTAAAPTSSGHTPWDWVKAHSALMIAVAGLIIIVAVLVLYQAARARGRANPLILQLGPSFFFWLGMTYTGVLLLAALVYNVGFADAPPLLLGGMLPVGVPWFGALGAVTISLEGVFLWSTEWKDKYNYWHIGRPLFGAVLGIVAFFLFVVIGAAAGTPPKFLDGPGTALPKDFIIYYVLAFLVGYREGTFRELIKRATDLILKPETPQPAPDVTFRVGGVTSREIQCPSAAASQSSSMTVEVQNSGNAALIAPVVAVASVGQTPGGTFAIANDLVTGKGDLAPNQAKSVDVTFTPPAAGDFSGTLTVTATNLSTLRTIRVTGHQ